MNPLLRRIIKRTLAFSRYSRRFTWKILFLMLLCPLAESLHAQSPPSYTMLGYWSFDDTNWLSGYGYTPISFTNLVNVTNAGNGNTLLLDNTNTAWLQYNTIENDGTTNLTVDAGTVMFWFSPDWSGTNVGGTGPGVWGRLIEVGAYTPGASYGWWSLFVDPDGVNLYFAGQTNNGFGATYLSAPIAWTNNTWHFIALSYSATNSALYLDGSPPTNGSGVTYFPGPDVRTNGFYVGSDSNGVNQARGMIDDLSTYNSPLDDFSVGETFDLYSIVYYGGNFQTASYMSNLNPAPPSPVSPPSYNAITGPGYLVPVSTNTGSCVSSSIIWLTNALATPTTNGTMNLTFTIAGGSNSIPYDVFANSVLGTVSSTNVPWAWMGQGYQCTTYQLTNLPNASAFLILGTPLDSDGDGLTDAFEKLVTHSDPMVPDTALDGLSDLFKLLHSLPATNIVAVPSLNSISIPTCSIP